MRKGLPNAGWIWIAMATALGTLGSPAPAQAETRLVASIPFDFVVRDVQLPAGKYDLTENENGVLAIQSAAGRHVALVLTIPGSADRTVTHPELVFAHREGEYFLARVVTDSDQARDLPLKPAFRAGERVAVALERGQSAANSSSSNAQ